MSDWIEVVARVIDALEAQVEADWMVGEVLLQLPDERGVYKAIASDVGKSASWVSEHQAAARAFPPGTRALDMPFGVHVLCARTDDAEGWLERAVSEQMSVAELRDALKAEGIIKSRESSKDESCANCVTLQAALCHIRDLLADAGPYDGSSLEGLRDYVSEHLFKQTGTS